jgi:hypothetical protein
MVRNRLHPVVFQQMQQRPQFILIQSMRHRPRKWRRSHPADAAQQGVTGAKILYAESFAANRAQATRLFRKIFPAGIADRHAGKTQERFAAKAAWSRKESAAEAVHRTSQHAGDRSPC